MCELKQKFREWEDWLFGDDIHSISHQIHRMIWDSAVFQSINEARKHAPKDQEGKPQLNGMVHEFINICFFKTQALTVRRMLDKRTDVVSLYRLIDDMEKNCHILTRAGILEAHGYPYDYDKAQGEFLEEQLRTKAKRGDANSIKFVFSHHMHENIDILCRVKPDDRKSQDCVKKEIFTYLKQKLDSCKSIYDYVNKFVAHSATPESRASINADEINITYGVILEAHKIICQTAGFLGLMILNRSFGGFLAIPQFDQFENFEKPWATEEIVQKLYAFWKGYDEETRKWCDLDWVSDLKEE